MRCAKCGSENPADNNFCARCGNALTRPCTTCGAENSPTSSFCGKCGAGFTNNTKSVGHISSARQSAPDIEVVAEHAGTALAFEGERKTVTALFADIKGSTELMRDLDPEEARAIVDPALKLMIDAARRYDCY